MLASPPLDVFGVTVHGVSPAERLLSDETERALRLPRGRVALALHLSRLRTPAPYPHHARVSRAMLQDIASRYGGQVFLMRNGDMVLLCSVEASGLATRSASPLALPAVLGRLFGADAPDPARLTSLWHLENDADTFRAYIAERHADPRLPEPAGCDDAGGIALVGAVEALIDAMPIDDTLTLQTAVHVRGGGPMPLSSRLAPLFRELTFSLATASARADLQLAIADPFLFRHFAARLDGRMLTHVRDDLLAGGKLTRPALLGRLPIHLNITLEGIVSPEFSRLAQAAERRGARFGIEISLMEAASDLGLLAYARQMLHAAGFALILDGLDHTALTMTHPAGLQPDLVKLMWSPRLADATAPMRATIAACIRRIGADRIVMQRADSEQAVIWGQAHGISRYQGFFLDAVQAARRIAVCHSARTCTLRQCTARSSTLNPGIRTGCGNPGLLDMAADQEAVHASAKPGAERAV